MYTELNCIALRLLPIYYDWVGFNNARAWQGNYFYAICAIYVELAYGWHLSS